MNSFSKADVLAVCQKFGPILKVPAGLDGGRVMAALASNESSTGANCGPRHEPAYDVNGGVWHDSATQKALVAEYGSLGASSFGPWQTMLINCPGRSPADLVANLEDCAQCLVAHFNDYVHHWSPASLQDIGQIWNLGHKTTTPPVGVVRYCADLQKAYESASVILEAAK